MSRIACPECEHEITMGRCWRLTCPSNGARESFNVVEPGPFYMGAKKASADLGRRVQSGHPSTWGEPPQQEFML